MLFLHGVMGVQGATVAVMAGTAGAASLGAASEEESVPAARSTKKPEIQ